MNTQATTIYPHNWNNYLSIVRNLCEELNRHDIAYCHWKSNAMLERSACGDNDLDLLIDRADVQSFSHILYALGFKLAQDPLGQSLPGVLNYYGFDADTGRCVHVHAHYQLILGHDATKNYHLTIESPYLESSVQGTEFKVPAPEFELIVFVIRMILKHSTWDAILIRQGTLSVAERHEMVYLRNLVSQEQICTILKQHLPFVTEKIFDNCIRALQPNCSFWNRVRVGRQLQNRLRHYARRSQVSDVLWKFWRRLIKAVRQRAFKYTPKKRMASGGLMVAIVGGDGAGKTTAIDGLHAWLSKDFDTIKVHMGRPSLSRTTIVVRGILKAGRLLGFYSFVKGSIKYSLDSNSQVFPGYPWLFREICTARDRYLTYVKARRFANNGGLVICDRFPLPQVKFMDGPQIERMTSTYKANWLIKFLKDLENKYYQPITPPELLVVLRANPDTAVQRKTDEAASSVRARSTEIWELNWRKTDAHVINAGRSKEDVLSELKALVWSQL